MGCTLLHRLLITGLCALAAGCTNHIELEGTDTSGLEKQTSREVVEDALGGAVFVSSTDQFIASYYVIDEPYAHDFERSSFSSYDGYHNICDGIVRSPLIPLGLACVAAIYTQLAVAGAEQSVEASKARKAQPRSGVVVFWNKAGSAQNAIKTILFDDPEASISVVSDLYAKALIGDADALAVIGVASLNPERSYALLCHASHRGSDVALEALAGGVLNGLYPSTNRVEEADLWFALAHARSTRKLYSKRPIETEDIQEYLADLERDYESLKLSSAANSVNQEPLSLRQEAIRRSITWRLTKNSDEFVKRLVEQLADHVASFRPDPDSCPPMAL